MNSEQSQRLETGSIVIRYTSAAMAKTAQPTMLFQRLKDVIFFGMFRFMSCKKNHLTAKSNQYYLPKAESCYFYVLKQNVFKLFFYICLMCPCVGRKVETLKIPIE